jgi:gliding motility-associated-like protein
VETNIRPEDLALPNVLTPTQTLQYWVEVVDSSGCRTQDSRTIRVDRERWVYIPNAFNPDSDNNSLLTVFGGEDVQEIKVFRIFDRWGNNLFERRAFQANDGANGWDGRYKGAMMNPAVFVYYVEILFVDGKTEVYKGDVTLIR